MFDFYRDYRLADVVVIREDSWMGLETSPASPDTAYVFQNPVHVTNGATLHVWEGAKIAFKGGLQIDSGASLVCEDGSTCIFNEPDTNGGSDDVVVYGGSELRVMEGSSLVIRNGVDMHCDTGSVCDLSNVTLLEEATLRVSQGGTLKGISSLAANDTTTVTVFGTLAISPNGVLSTGTGGRLIVGGTGKVQISDGARVIINGDSGPFSVGSNVTFQMDQDAKVAIWRDETVLDGVTFESWNGGEWDWVGIFGDNAEVKNSTFVGGRNSIYVRAHGVALRNVTSRNGFFGLATHYPEGSSSRAALTIEGSTFRDASNVGLSIQNANVEIFDTTVEDNGSSGIYAVNADIFGFQNNTVESNGSVGVMLASNASLETEPVTGTTGAFNVIKDNATHEIRLGSGSEAELGTYYPPGYGCNSITSSGDPSHLFLIYNGSTTTVRAWYNWWGSYPVGQNRFYSSEPTGAIEYSLELSATPENSSECYGNVFSSATASREGQSTGHTRGGTEGIGDRMRVIRDSLVANPQGPGAVDYVFDLGRLTRRDADDATGQRQANLSALNEVASATGAGRDLLPAAEAATLVLAVDALATGGSQRSFTVQSDPSSLSGGYGRAARLLEVFVLDREGRTDEALTLLAEVEAEELAMAAENSAFEPVDYGPVREILLEDEMQEPGVARASLAPYSLESTQIETGLSAPRPNPTRDGVAVSLSLDEASKVEVEVFDSVGRRVSTVMSGALEAGTHDLQVRGDILSPGVYVIRATSDQGLYTRTFTVVR